jgi:predicted RNA-binding Zn-ribbon protein involved in translation (DUF1610 family)
MAIGYERDYEDEVYEDEYYEEHFDEELIDEEEVDEEGFEDEEGAEEGATADDDERDEDDVDDEEDAVAKRDSERKIEVSYACEDCDYRWEDVIIKRKDVLDDYDDEHDIICPMCGSVNISII